MLPVKVKPSYTEPSLYIRTGWKGANAETIEREVTSVLEGTLGQVPGCLHVESSTEDERSNISLVFNKEADMQMVRQEAASIVRRLYPRLPEGVGYPSISVRGQSAESRPFMVYSIVSPLDQSKIQEMGRDELIPRLTELKGVNDASIHGAEDMQWHITFDRDRMDALGITVRQLKAAIRGIDRWDNLGMLEEDQLYTVLVSKGLKDWGSLVLTAQHGRVIYLRDVAKIALETSEPERHYRLNGMTTVTLSVTPEEGANQVLLSEQVKEVINDAEEQWDGQAHFVLRKDDSEYIAQEVAKITNRTLFTLAILFVFVALIAWNLRYVLVTMLCIVVNLCLSFLLFYLLGIELHLYSFAGMTVSLGIIIDNCIVMIDHLRHKNNYKVFLALLSATLTTMASLSVIFFLSDRLRLNLVDFGWVIIINLGVSLVVALFFVPAILAKVPLYTAKATPFQVKKKRLALYFQRVYLAVLRVMARRKWVAFALIILLFGLPVYMLPSHLGDRRHKGEQGTWKSAYNATLGSEFYNSNLREYVDVLLGGTLRLFTEKVRHSRYFTTKERTNLVLKMQMPVGARLEHMNEAFLMIESYLKQFPEIEEYETNIRNAQSGQMTITFKEENEFSGFPFLLQDLLVQKAVEIGSADSQVFGQGDAFNNSTKEQIGQYQIDLYGYNYQQLYQYAERLRDSLMMNVRVNEVNIMGRNRRYRENNFGYVLTQDDDLIALADDHFNYIYQEMLDFAMDTEQQGNVKIKGTTQNVFLSSSERSDFNLWNLNNDLVQTRQAAHKLGEVARIEKKRLPESIHRKDQQYYLKIEYDFIGPSELGYLHLDETMVGFKRHLPMGYTAETITSRLKKDEKGEQVYMVLLVVLIIYFVCAILFESLLQPLAVICIIPISFIGVFLSFYLFEINFDQGGFGAFILLSGLTVNSALFIVNDMNNLRLDHRKPTYHTKVKTYLKAFHTKIVPILLAILSTVMGLGPYLIMEQKEAFWYPLAIGTSGGLIFSLVAIYFYLPLFFIPKTRTK